MADYVQEMQEKLKASRARLRQGREIKALKASAPTLFDIIDTEISLELNRGYDDKAPLSYEQYLESHGAVRGIRRIRNLIDAKESEEVQAAQEVEALEENIKLVSSDGTK